MAEPVIGAVDRVVLRVAICDARDASVGRIGVAAEGVVVERPRLTSTAVRRSDRAAIELRVDGCDEE